MNSCLFCGKEVSFLRVKFCNSKCDGSYRRYGLNEQETLDVDAYHKSQKKDATIQRNLSREAERNRVKNLKIEKKQRVKINYLRDKLKRDIRFHLLAERVAFDYINVFKSSSLDALRKLIDLPDRSVTLEPEIFVIDGKKKYVKL